MYKLSTDAYKVSIRGWQGMNLFHTKVQTVAEGSSVDQEAVRVVSDLDEVTRLTSLKRDVLMWRGVRNWDKAFGVKTLSELDGFDRQQSRFIAIGTSREVAEDEFTTFGKACALLRVKARKGSSGVWMPTNGNPDRAYQQEFLLPPGVRVKVVGVKRGNPPIIDMEVSDGKE